MMQHSLALGIDLGTSGVRVAVLSHQRDLLYTDSTDYDRSLAYPDDWLNSCIQLIKAIPHELRSQLRALAVDGTSGTLVACDPEGTPKGEALPYNVACPEQLDRVRELVQAGQPASSASGSLARALRLLEQHSQPLILRHQADWISGWLLGDWSFGEEGNNLRLGWSLSDQRWPDAFEQQSWRAALPEIRPSGSMLGTMDPARASQLGLCGDILVIAGTTDANAAVLTADAADDEGITVLGSTLVLKRFTDKPLHDGVGTSNHRVGGRWLGGGASNSGGAVLRECFPGIDLDELSRQIDPDQDSGLQLRPLIGQGERFPVDDPDLEPILTPRPVSDALYLHGLLEGLSQIECQGWTRLTELGAPAPKRLVTLGGGARNPQWRRLRQRLIGVPIRSCYSPPAAGVARLALSALQQQHDQIPHSGRESTELP
ncbi:FGGY-family carbohydrate kinase [Synechococcus sp. MIT S9509]|uniref:FGGY-family carbohydrate kinase n=1 Tax=Synechococcus sp. MIT S9509 TaxID=1801630 RepID=UPI003514DA24